MKSVDFRLETASQSGDIRVLRSLLFPRFSPKVELGYDKARTWHSFLLDALTPGGVWARRPAVRS